MKIFELFQWTGYCAVYINITLRYIFVCILEEVGSSVRLLLAQYIDVFFHKNVCIFYEHTV